MAQTIEEKCLEKGLRMTEQRKIIIRVLSESPDHPDVETLYERAVKIDSNISVPTIYRTLRLLEEANIIKKHDFGNGRLRYEEVTEEHHDHLIDLRSGKVVEFTNEQIEKLQEQVARELGYRLVDHRLELYCVPIDD